MLVFNRIEPCLDIELSDMTIGPNVGNKYGLHRDRYPDRDWSELRRGDISYAKEVEETDALKLTLLEDLAYTYGKDTKMFTKKLSEFGFIERDIYGAIKFKL